MKKKILTAVAVLAILVLSLLIFLPKEEKLYFQDVQALYGRVEITPENFNIYYELVELDEKDAFGETTGTTYMVAQEHDGCFPSSESVIVRITCTVTEIKYPVGTERPEIPTEGLENCDFFVSSNVKEYDIEIPEGNSYAHLLRTKYTQNGYVYESLISDLVVEKAMGSVITYDPIAIDALIKINEDGNKSITIWTSKKSSFTIDDFTMDMGDRLEEDPYRCIYGYIWHLS